MINDNNNLENDVQILNELYSNVSYLVASYDEYSSCRDWFNDSYETGVMKANEYEECKEELERLGNKYQMELDDYNVTCLELSNKDLSVFLMESIKACYNDERYKELLRDIITGIMEEGLTDKFKLDRYTDVNKFMSNNLHTIKNTMISVFNDVQKWYYYEE